MRNEKHSIPRVEELKGLGGIVMQVRCKVCTMIDNIEVTLNPIIMAFTTTSGDAKHHK